MVALWWARNMARHPQILSTGSYVPERVVTNAEVDALMGASTNEWLIANVGIKERRWMSPEQVTSDSQILESSRRRRSNAQECPLQIWT